MNGLLAGLGILGAAVMVGSREYSIHVKRWSRNSWSANITGEPMRVLPAGYTYASGRSGWEALGNLADKFKRMGFLE